MIKKAQFGVGGVTVILGLFGAGGVAAIFSLVQWYNLDARTAAICITVITGIELFAWLIKGTPPVTK